MFRSWMLWTLLVALTCGMIAGCSPEGGRPSTPSTTDADRK